MATELGKAYVQIMPSAKGMASALKKELDMEMPEAGRSAGIKLGTGLKVAAMATFAAAGVALGKVISSSISEGADLQQSLGGIETLFKGSADKVKKYADMAYKTSGLSANAYMENVTSFSASLLQSLGGDTAKAADKANMAMIDMSDNQNKMGSNMEDIQNAYQGFAKQNYTMLDNLKLGYGGTKEEMQRLLSDATKLTGVKYDINNLSDVYTAIHAIQGNLGITGTTAKEAATTFSGSFAAMKAAAQNVLGKMPLGKNITKDLKALADTTSTFLFGNFIPMVTNVVKALPGAIVTLITSAGPQFLSAGKKIITSLVSGISGGKSTLTTTFSGIFSTIQNVFSKLDFSGVKAVFDAIIPAVTNAFTVMMSIVGPAIEQVVTSFGKLWNAAQPLITVLASALMPVLQVLGAFLGGVFKGVLMGISGIFDLVRIAIQILTPVVSFLVDVFKACAPALTIVAQWVGTVIGAFTSLGGAGGTLRGILSGAWNNIKSVVSLAGDVIKGVIGGVRAVFTALGSAGSTLKNGLSAVWNGIKSVISTAGNIINSVISSVRNVFSALGNSGNSLRNAISGAWNGMRNAVSGVANSIGGIVNNVRGVFNSLGHISLFGAGSAIMRGFLNGLKSMWNSITSFVGGIASWIKKHKGPISYDKKLLIPAGQAIMTGLNNGLEENFKDVKSNVSSMADRLDFSLTPKVAFDDSGLDINSKFNSSYQDVVGQMNIALDSGVAQPPVFEVHNEIVGDKIYTSVKTKESRADDLNNFLAF